MQVLAHPFCCIQNRNEVFLTLSSEILHLKHKSLVLTTIVPAKQDLFNLIKDIFNSKNLIFLYTILETKRSPNCHRVVELAWNDAFVHSTQLLSSKVFNCGWLCTPSHSGHIWHRLERNLLSYLSECPWNLAVEAKHTTKYPIRCKTTLVNKELSSPKCQWYHDCETLLALWLLVIWKWRSYLTRESTICIFICHSATLFIFLWSHQF